MGMDVIKDTANTEGKMFVKGMIELSNTPFMEYLMKEQDRLNKEHAEIFAGYTDQQYLEEQVYGPKQ